MKKNSLRNVNNADKKAENYFIKVVSMQKTLREKNAKHAHFLLATKSKNAGIQQNLVILNVSLVKL